MQANDNLHIEKRKGYHLVVDPGAPNWLATNDDGAWVLRELRAGRSCDDIAYRYAKRHSLSLARALALVGPFADEVASFVHPPARPPYRGRAAYLQTDRLKELWLHLTDRCNLSCRHCLVSSGPRGEEGLPAAVLLRTVRQARDLGADTFYLTGGEPLTRKDIVPLLGQIATHFAATAVLLTNGCLIDEELVSALRELPRHRLFLQVSLDGSTPERNDALRSPGSFDAAVRGLRLAADAGLNVTVATVVLDRNLDDLIPLADLVRGLGVSHLHLLWQHRRERGARFRRAAPSRLISHVVSLASHAGEIGLTIDNFESLRSVINGDPGLKRDLSNACWDSLAVYRDGRVFPSACLVGVESQAGGCLEGEQLRDIWLGSPALEAWRARSVIHGVDGDPLVFLHGGGDPEQAFFSSHGDGAPSADPLLPLHRALIRHLMDQIAGEKRTLIGDRPGPVVYHLMGDDGHACPPSSGVRNGGEHKVDFVHSNCVLIPDVVARARAQVQRYYREAAREVKAEVCSPVAMPRAYLSHIPEQVIARSYGCGSPVLAAELRPGETVLDLGSGAGLECFVAARLVGPGGRVIGVDMTSEMVQFAQAAAPAVAHRLGYANVEFRQGLLEALPLQDAAADAVISNCVINLSPEKLKVFAEMRRLLKPGGRAVIADLVSEQPLSADLRFNPRLRDECIAGALTERKLLLMLGKLGFEEVEVLTRAPWRTVAEVPFHSLTVRATKPGPPGAIAPSIHSLRDCLVCAAPLTYLTEEIPLTCHYCGETSIANARCQAGHFVCDHCHTHDHIAFIKSFSARTRETDPIALFSAMRRAHLFPLHGPEHHVLVTAAFLTAYRNCSGEPAGPRIEAAIDRAAALPGGTCAYWGACSAALGIGIAFATILQATPLSTDRRGQVQTIVSRLLADLGRLPAARCCRRESYLTLRLACQLSGDYLPHPLPAADPPPCDQTTLNRECLGPSCPLHPTA